MSKPKKLIHQGNLVAKPGVVYEFEEITGYLYARGAQAGAFPALTTTGGDLYASDAQAGAFPALTTTGGDLYASDAQAGAFPALTTTGGDLYARGAQAGAFPALVKTNHAEARANTRPNCLRILFEANLKLGYFYADGILARLVSRRGRVARVVICGKANVSYVVDDGNGNYSHGETLDKAREGLIYKLSSRDTARFKSWKMCTEVSLADAIQAYRAITGACEAGTRHFCERQGELPQTLTIADAIKRTKGQYGAESFAAFFAA